MWILIRISLIIIGSVNYSLCYTIPAPTITELLPKGFKVSIPDDPDIKLFGFHGKINHTFDGNELGEFFGDTIRKYPSTAEWIYENRKLQLNVGDVLYYWIYVQHNSLSYLLEDQKYVVGSTSPSSLPDDSTKGPLDIDIRDASSTDKNDPICTSSITTVRGKAVCANVLIFDEQFNNLNMWKHQVQIPSDSKDAEFVSYQRNVANVCFTKNGQFHATPKLLAEVDGFNEERIATGELDLLQDCTAHTNIECQRKAELFRILPPVVSCKINTKETFSFKYGKIEIRAKLPRGDWLFPQLFLDPMEAVEVDQYKFGQMRVAFIRSNEILNSKENISINGQILAGGVVLAVGERYRDVWLKNKLMTSHLNDEFHTYSLVWTEQSIILAVDGSTYGTLSGDFASQAKLQNITNWSQWHGWMAPFDKEFYVTVGVGVGGISDFPDNCRNGVEEKPKPWVNSSPKAELRFWNDHLNWHQTWNRNSYGLTIDYIKVWSL